MIFGGFSWKKSTFWLRNAPKSKLLDLPNCLIWIFTPKITFLLFSWRNTKWLHLFYNFPLFGSSDDDFYNRLLFNISAAQMLLLLDPFCTSIGACSTVDRGNCIAPSFSSCLIDLSSRKTAKNERRRRQRTLLPRQKHGKVQPFLSKESDDHLTR